MMTAIYTEAKGVLVWLGHDKKAEEALRSLPSDEDIPVGDNPPCIQNALHLPWFSRRWVIQEAVLNRNTVVYCGAVSKHLYDVGRNALQLMHFKYAIILGPKLLKRAEGLDAVFNLFFYKHVATYSYYEMEFTSLMLAFDEYECQNPRDRIFTLATLAKDMAVRNVTVEWVHQALATEQSGDPTKDLRTWRSHETYVNYEATTADIYILFAYSLAINGKLGWMLGQASARLSASTGGCTSHPDLDLLPRWVPNWTVKYHRHAFWLEGNDVRCGPWVNLANAIGPPLVHCALARFPASSGAFAYRIRTRLGRIFRSQSAGTAVEDSFESAEEDRVCPFVVTWKSETFPSYQLSPADVVQWIRRTFQSIWEVGLSGMNTKVHDGDVKERLAGRFCYVLVAGAYMYSDKRLSSNLKSAAAELAELAQTIPTMANSSHEQSPRRMLDMLVHPSQFWDDAEKKKDELLAPIIVKLLKEIIFNDPDITVPGWNCALQMVSITMEHRCVLTCDVDNPPADALPFDIVGIGPDHLGLGDRVFSLPLRRKHFRDEEQFERPITKEYFEDVAYAPLAFQNVWAATYLARPMGGVHVVHSQPVEDGAEAEHPKIFQFVGDCFLSTVRWLSPSRGLMPKAWLSYETEDSDEAACQKEFGDRYSDFDEDGEIYLC
ncbi:hypothetical protein CGMCC3_g15154 [Colletotrichum fructicola]|nr:uncharacterized protein CGMCC3_g15154 [Colletotrichum fructicola]KAF4491282.1 hypothetical protein CGGC5_v002545 [Colletotrichum fructicola Nara gc5]KAE9568769.1 hypothetical protein CGMCC3_g15154 [Colletotrichum fructicola]KAF4890200.1 hypothetical protein CGCFRS4_v008915 [Colletotrichum fructicola]KAF4932381.1 hypothetical protein CGCF245_v010644 [Colletotrichum fructicola]KAF5508663.1 hypothetical protein CGCF413_v002192 [Colletotrichum fructicola]